MLHAAQQPEAAALLAIRHVFVTVLVSCWLVLGVVYPATAQAAQVIIWNDLQPKQTVDFAATFDHLSRKQLQDLATLARIRWWLADQLSHVW